MVASWWPLLREVRPTCSSKSWNWENKEDWSSYTNKHCRSSRNCYSYAGFPIFRFSTNEGETWTEFKFSEKEVFVYQLLTEPGEKSTIFTIFGSYAEQRHSWLILQVNASDVLSEFSSLMDGFMVNAEDSGQTWRSLWSTDPELWIYYGW